MCAIRRDGRAARDGGRFGSMREGSKRSMRALFPFAPLVMDEWVSHFLSSSRVGAWPCLGRVSQGSLNERLKHGSPARHGIGSGCEALQKGSLG
jgi:hypothetical protein